MWADGAVRYAGIPLKSRVAGPRPDTVTGEDVPAASSGAARMAGRVSVVGPSVRV